MTRQIPKQYWKFYPPEHLAQRDEQIVRENASSTPSYFETLRRIALQRCNEFTSVNEELEIVRSQILIEALSTVKNGGLELILTPDANGIVSDEQLLNYASLPTQRKYQETRREAEIRLRIAAYLVATYNQQLNYYTDFFSDAPHSLSSPSLKDNSNFF